MTAYGRVPLSLLEDERIGEAYLRVYIALASAVGFRAATGTVRVGRIAERAGRSERMTRRALTDLAAWGYVERTREAAGKPYRYVVNGFVGVHKPRDSGEIPGQLSFDLGEGPAQRIAGRSGNAMCRTPQSSSRECTSEAGEQARLENPDPIIDELLVALLPAKPRAAVERLVAGLAG